MTIVKFIVGRTAALFCLYLMVSVTAAAPSSAAIRSDLTARTFYISPDGDDNSDGLTSGTPWETWPHALRDLRPGDTLIVGDGVWTNEAGDDEVGVSRSGLININCSPRMEPDLVLGHPYANGKPDAPITIRAKNERQCLLRSNGAKSSISVKNAKYWVFEGLRGECADLSADDGGYERSNFRFENCENLTIRRMLGAKNNRYFNDHIFKLIRCSDCLLEENEAYDFHRHGFSASLSKRITFTRNYAHSRGRPDITGGRVSHTPDYGDEGLTCYFSHGCVVQNCIVEDSEGIQATGDDNTFLGSIALGGNFGFRFASNCQDSGAQQCDYEEHYPTNNRGEHLLSLNASTAGFDLDASGDSVLRNATAVGSRIWGFAARDRLTTPNFVTSFQLSYCLSMQEKGGPLFEIQGEGATAGFIAHAEVDQAWGGRYLNSFGHSVNFSPVLSNDYGKWADISMEDPKLNGCYVFIPNGTPMHLGSEGLTEERIGAHILYRYEKGMLTKTPLWDKDTGAFPGGAIVAGVNDPDDGECLANVHKRLNLANNRSLQSAYEQ